MLSMNGNQNKISNILQQVRLLKNKYDKLAAATGEDFNIFSILRIKHKEVITHTPMLAELLDPHGSHRQGAAFLKRFLEICIEDQEYTDLETFRVRSEERTDRGQFDILIEKEQETCIVIENKIYAGDQPHQLNNYYQDAKGNEFNQIKLIYLTLDGSEPSEESLKAKNGQGRALRLNDVELISYRKHIISWLEECMRLQEVKHISPIREILFQYLDLLKELTGQPTNTRHSMGLINILKQDENYELITNLEEMILEFKVHLQYEFWEELKKQILGLPEVDWHKTLNDDYVPSKGNIRNFYSGSRDRELYQTFHLGTAWKQYELALYTGIEYGKDVELDKIYFAFTLLKNGEHVDWKKIKWLKNPADQLDDEFEHDDYWHIWKYSKREIGFPVRYPSPVVEDLLNNKKREKVVRELVGEISEAINKLKKILKKGP